VQHKHALAVHQAATLISRHHLTGFEAHLTNAWKRFFDADVKSDPRCLAKEATLTALDAHETLDPDPFLQGVRCVQVERAYGGGVDTAGGVRQRALFALLRQYHSDAELYAGELLADPLVEVRIGTAEALGEYGGPAAASLLIHRLRNGDDLRVLVACATSVVRLAEEFALPLLGSWLRSGNAEQNETAAVALGQSRSDAAATMLVTWLPECVTDTERETAIRGLAASRTELARGCLLEYIAESSFAGACVAVRALSAHSYDSRLCTRVREAAAQNPEPKLRKLVAESFRA
jgi:hypothetical protein